MSTFTARAFADVFTDARAIGLLNDLGADRYTDAALLPHGAYTHLEIQEECAASGIPLVETVISTPTYTANATTITVPGAVTDLREPMELWEKNTADSYWRRMERVNNLRPPLISARTSLYEWEWHNGAIRVLACSVNKDIFMRYRRQLAYPTAALTLDFDGIYTALVAGTAFYAATGRPEVQAKAGSAYDRAVSRLKRILSRDRQEISYRRRAWNDTGGRYTPLTIRS